MFHRDLNYSQADQWESGGPEGTLHSTLSFSSGAHPSFRWVLLPGQRIRVDASSFSFHIHQPGPHTFTQTINLWQPGPNNAKPDEMKEPGNAREIRGAFTAPPIEFELLDRAAAR